MKDISFVVPGVAASSAAMIPSSRTLIVVKSDLSHRYLVALLCIRHQVLHSPLSSFMFRRLCFHLPVVVRFETDIPLFLSSFPFFPSRSRYTVHGTENSTHKPPVPKSYA